MTSSHDAEHFRQIYARNADPWAFQTSAYEQEKYQRTLAALGGRRFRSGFEPGCSIGVLTRLLATRCDALLAADIVEEPLCTARKLCVDLPWVRFTRLSVPDEWPDGHFDLIVLSEVPISLHPRTLQGWPAACSTVWTRMVWWYRSTGAAMATTRAAAMRQQPSY